MLNPLSTALQAEYAALTLGAGYVALPDRTQIEIRGVDRAKFLHNFCTNDIKRLTDGEGCEAFVLNAKGKTIGHVLVFCGPQSLILETVPGQAATLITHLDRFLIREDVELRDRTADWAEILIGGDKAAGLLDRLAGAAPPASCSHATARIAGCEAALRRVPWLAAPCWLLACEAAETARLSDALHGAGAIACGAKALEIARLEAGWPLFGRDIHDDNLPQEIDRDDRAISFTKGCYLGQETVARIDALGHVNRKLAPVKFASSDVPSAGTELFCGEATVGHVTSAAWSPRFAAPLALAFLKSSLHKPGTPLISPLGAAEVCDLQATGSSGAEAAT